MGPKTLVVTKSARADIDDVLAYLAQTGGIDVALRFADRIDDELHRLADLGHGGANRGWLAPTLAITLPDPKDVHVVAAAHHGACPTILTFNLTDFPAATLAALTPPVAAVHPDAFLVGLLTTNAADVLAIIERVRQNLTTSPMTVNVYADSLERSHLPQTAELLRHLLIG